MSRTLRTPNLAHLLTRTARLLPEHRALVRGDASMTWHDIDADAHALATALRARGIEPGDVVLVHCANSFDLVVVMFAVLRTGAVYAPTNARLSPAETAKLAAVCRPHLFVHDDSPEHADAMPAVDALSVSEARTLTETHRGARRADAPRSCGDPAMLMFTSGSTGLPKAAVLPHDQLGFVVNNQLADVMPGLGPSDTSLVVAPLSHGAGIHFYAQVARGATSVLTSRNQLDPEEVWELVERHRVTNMFTVPTILKRLVESPAVEHRDHASLRHVIYSGAPLHRKDKLTALRQLGPVLVQHYGLVEVTANITVLPPDLHDTADPNDDPIDTCGVERTGMQVSIQDDEGRELPTGAEGEICACGPAVFAGYLDNQAANDAAFRDGWFRTGDIGRLDERGYLYITGRLSDMYISGGSNIYPRELEEQLRQHPAIADVAVVGVPDDTWGEVGVAVCVRRSPVDEAQLLDWMRGRMTRYKVPKHVEFWDDLPRSGYGKVERKAIKTTLTEQLSLRGTADNGGIDASAAALP